MLSVYTLLSADCMVALIPLGLGFLRKGLAASMCRAVREPRHELRSRPSRCLRWAQRAVPEPVR
eukprot:1337853-Pyramimonas_sp.AAC.1